MSPNRWSASRVASKPLFVFVAVMVSAGVMLSVLKERFCWMGLKAKFPMEPFKLDQSMP